MILVLTSEQLRSINMNFVSYHEYPKSYRSDACYSSYLYRETIEEQITDIVVKLVKSHYFPDGNKRTAVAVYFLLCKNAHIKCLPDEKVDKAILQIASEHVIDISDVTFNKYVKLLFPKFEK
jgi:death-on-curing family protein